MNYTQQHIRTWLLSKPIISIRKLERAAGCPKDTIRHFLKERRSLPDENEEALSNTLRDYGFTPLNDE